MNYEKSPVFLEMAREKQLDVGDLQIDSEISLANIVFLAQKQEALDK